MHPEHLFQTCSLFPDSSRFGSLSESGQQAHLEFAQLAVDSAVSHNLAAFCWRIIRGDRSHGNAATLSLDASSIELLS